MKDNILAELKGKGMYSVDPESAHAYVLAGVLFTAAPFILAASVGRGVAAGIARTADRRGRSSRCSSSFCSRGS